MLRRVALLAQTVLNAIDFILRQLVPCCLALFNDSCSHNGIEKINHILSVLSLRISDSNQ
jgi:hypothetical protein